METWSKAICTSMLSAKTWANSYWGPTVHLAPHVLYEYVPYLTFTTTPSQRGRNWGSQRMGNSAKELKSKAKPLWFQRPVLTKNSKNTSSYCSTQVTEEGLGYTVHSLFLSSQQDCEENTLQIRNLGKVTLKVTQGPWPSQTLNPHWRNTKSKLF